MKITKSDLQNYPPKDKKYHYIHLLNVRSRIQGPLYVNNSYFRFNICKPHRIFSGYEPIMTFLFKNMDDCINVCSELDRGHIRLFDILYSNIILNHFYDKIDSVMNGDSMLF